jgi:hypothetical protein
LALAEGHKEVVSGLGAFFGVALVDLFLLNGAQIDVFCNMGVNCTDLEAEETLFHEHRRKVLELIV